MSDAQREVRPDKASLADAIAERFAVVVTDAVATRGTAHVVLTGGSMGTAFLEAVGRLERPVDWSHIEVWWGDERFLPEGDPERNVVQAREALLDRLPEPPRMHVMAATDGPDGTDLSAAAGRYARELEDAFGTGFEQRSTEPVFDVVMLGMGPDTHVASLFPGSSQTQVDDAVAVAVEDSPKPPPRRISLTFPVLNSTREAWLMIAGADKAQAVRDARATSDRTAHPASGIHGRSATIWWLDEAAAG